MHSCIYTCIYNLYIESLYSKTSHIYIYIYLHIFHILLPTKVCDLVNLLVGSCGTRRGILLPVLVALFFFNRLCILDPLLFCASRSTCGCLDVAWSLNSPETMLVLIYGYTNHYNGSCSCFRQEECIRD